MDRKSAARGRLDARDPQITTSHFNKEKKQQTSASRNRFSQIGFNGLISVVFICAALEIRAKPAVLFITFSSVVINVICVQSYF